MRVFHVKRSLARLVLKGLCQIISQFHWYTSVATGGTPPTLQVAFPFRLQTTPAGLTNRARSVVGDHLATFHVKQYLEHLLFDNRWQCLRLCEERGIIDSFPRTKRPRLGTKRGVTRLHLLAGARTSPLRREDRLTRCSHAAQQTVRCLIPGSI